MTCTNNCRCGKHDQHKGTRPLDGPSRSMWQHSFGEQQRQRQHRMHAERRALGLQWRGTPSEDFDTEAAIAGLYRVFDRVYGKRWRNRLRGVR